MLSILGGILATGFGFVLQWWLARQTRMETRWDEPSLAAYVELLSVVDDVQQLTTEVAEGVRTSGPELEADAQKIVARMRYARSRVALLAPEDGASRATELVGKAVDALAAARRFTTGTYGSKPWTDARTDIVTATGNVTSALQEATDTFRQSLGTSRRARWRGKAAKQP